MVDWLTQVEHVRACWIAWIKCLQRTQAGAELLARLRGKAAKQVRQVERVLQAAYQLQRSAYLRSCPLCQLQQALLRPVLSAHSHQLVDTVAA